MVRDSGRREQGFTLIELLIAIAVSGLILSALTTGFIAALRGTAGAHDRFVASNGSQTFATYFTSDVQSANPALVSTAAADGTGCSSTPALPAQSTNILRLQWTEMTTATKLTAFSVSYRMEPSSGSRWELRRYYCSAEQDGGTPVAAAMLLGATASSHVMATDLADPDLHQDFVDGHTASGQPDITSQSADFSTADIGQTITGAGIQNNTTVVAVVSSSKVTLSKTATATSLAAGFRLNRHALATVAGSQISMSVYARPSNGEPPYGYRLTASMRTPTLVPRVSSIIRFPGDPDPTNGATLRWSVVFSEPVTPGTVDKTDFNLASSITSVTTTDNQTFTVVAPTGPDGTVGLNLVDDDSITDSDANKLGGTGVNNGDFAGQTYTVDKTRPTVNVTPKPGQPDPTGVQPILFTVQFIEPVLGFDATDVVKSGSSTGGVATVTGSGKDYEIAISGLTGDGTVIVTIGANAAADPAGNLSRPPTSPASVQFAGPPMVTSIVRADSNPTSATTLRWTVTFNKPVTGVGSDDFQAVKTGGVAGLTTPAVTGSGTTWTVSVDRTSGYGTVGLNLVDNDSIVFGGAPLEGPGGPDGSRVGEVYTVSAVKSIALLNSGAGSSRPGQMEKSDQIVVTFTTAIDPSSLCSSWASGSGNRGPVNVVVGVADSTTNDAIAMSSAACTTHVGTVTLGDGSYISGGSMTFGAGGTNSTMSWDATNLKLIITLGQPSNGGSSGNVGPAVTSSTATYSPDPAIKDSAGTAIDTPSVQLTGQLF